MADAILTYLFCIAIHFVMLLGINLRADSRELSSRRFTNLLYASLSFQICTLVSELYEGNSSAFGVLYASNFLAFLAADLLMISFARYLYVLIHEDEKHLSFFLKLPIICTIISMCLVIAFALAGKLFTIENGHYAETEFTIIPYVSTAVAIVQALAIVIRKRSCFSKREFTVILLYLILPVTPIIIELYTELYTLTPVFDTLSILMIYVLIQAVTIEKSRIREQMLEEISSTDQLTGLNNRRAFYERISRLNADDSIGVLFCDLNRLKYTNDTFGHAAGDELICRFGTVLTSSFSFDTVYRISGDEFIVLLPDKTEDAFVTQTDALRREVASRDDMAAIGAAYGIGCNIDRLLSEAENDMYRSKRSYYSDRNISNDRGTR